MEHLLKKNIDNTKVCPAICVEAKDANIKCLIDTGADTPVWTFGAELLLKAFPNAELQRNLYFELGGFGKGREDIPVYKIPQFVIKSDYDNEYVLFKNLLVACCVRNSIPYPLILSATMFSHINYAIVNVGEDAPIFKMAFNKREYEIGPFFKNRRANIVNRIYSFSQNE